MYVGVNVSPNLPDLNSCPRPRLRNSKWRSGVLHAHPGSLPGLPISGQGTGHRAQVATWNCGLLDGMFPHVLAPLLVIVVGVGVGVCGCCDSTVRSTLSRELWVTLGRGRLRTNTAVTAEDIF